MKYMPISYPEILNFKTVDVAFSWTDRDSMLYALGTGMGEDPLHERELAFVYERNLKVLPTFATIVARAADPGPLPINSLLVLDGGRDLWIHRPLDGSASVVMDGRIMSAVDKGASKGAIITREVVIRDASTRAKIATLRSNLFARGDGGFGGPTDDGKETPVKPDRQPDRTVDIVTRPNQALLYRLSGDRNPLHSDPAVATKAGFDRPILHGLCTYAICCRAILESYADFDCTAIERLAARFAAPAFPGETISVDIWSSGRDLAFEARVKSRGATIVKYGQAVLR
jgi:acyl dehydratase